MSDTDLIIRGRRVVFDKHVGPASVHITDGKISHIGEFAETAPKCEQVEADEDAVIMPGLVDTHVHINSPGRSDWEGFETATRAAAAGGVTTLIDMPLNSIPSTTSTAALQEKLRAAQSNCFVDVGFWGGLVPGNTGELVSLRAAGVVGFKCFLVPSGVDEFPRVTESDLMEAMPELARMNSLLIVHAELPGPIERAPKNGADNSYEAFLSSRPRQAEGDAIDMMIRLSRKFDTRVHIVHLSSADALPALRKAQTTGVRVSAETCPHYLHFAAEEIPDGATEFKCCPPIRERNNRELLWGGLADGTIAFIVSDHSPCPGSMKLRDSGDFRNAWGGIASLQLRLSVVWTEAHRRGFTFTELVKWLCQLPALQVALEKRKGAIAKGLDADIVIWKPEQEFVVDEKALLHRHKISPYIGETLKGVVQKTFLRGRKIYDGLEIARPATGQFLLSGSEPSP